MNKGIIFNTMLFVCSTLSMQVNAQLEVQTSGDVKVSKNLKVADTLTVGENFCVTNNLVLGKNIRTTNNVTAGKKLTVNQNAAIGTNVNDHISLNIEHTCDNESTPIPYYGIKSHIKTCSSMPTSPVYGVYGLADCASSTALTPNSPLVGVIGLAFKSYIGPTVFSAGVAGVTHHYGGIGIYGGIRSDNAVPTSMPTSSTYAGYFDGAVNVNGNITATSFSIDADLRSYENVHPLSSGTADIIHSLNPVSYTLKPDSAWMLDMEAKELQQGTHYGLIAQDLQKIAPELVYKRADKLSINYIELIPLLVKTIQELSAEVEALKKSNPKVRSLSSNKNAANEDIIEAMLYQNNPNPFSVDTKIEYQLPLSTQSATLYVYDMNGLQIEKFPISSYGEGSVVVSGGVLDAGIYLYSLIADGQIVDTKRMILTK